MKPYAESCDQNRGPILGVIEPLLRNATALLEIGSGTGQHAVYFAAKMPHLTWYASDCAEYHDGIRQWLEEAALPNTRGPLLLDVTQSDWQAPAVEAVFSANTAHIMPIEAVEAMVRGVGALLPAGGCFLLYGPFNYGGRYTSDSNARFDRWLAQRDPRSAIRDFEQLDAWAGESGMTLEQDCAMPANNRTLCWRKS